MIPVSMVTYWMMILWLKQSDTCVNGGLLNDDIKTKLPGLKQSDTCVNSGLLNDDTLIKTKWYLEIKTKWYLTNVSIVVYWNMIFWLKQMCQSGLLNNDILLWMVIYWMMILWLKQMCQWWFIERWYFD